VAQAPIGRASVIALLQCEGGHKGHLDSGALHDRRRSLPLGLAHTSDPRAFSNSVAVISWPSGTRRRPRCGSRRCSGAGLDGFSKGRATGCGDLAGVDLPEADLHSGVASLSGGRTDRAHAGTLHHRAGTTGRFVVKGPGSCQSLGPGYMFIPWLSESSALDLDVSRPEGRAA